MVSVVATALYLLLSAVVLIISVRTPVGTICVMLVREVHVMETEKYLASANVMSIKATILNI